MKRSMQWIGITISVSISIFAATGRAQEEYDIALLSAGGGALVSGITIYAMATPSAPKTSDRTAFTNANIGIIGRF